jgi:hypothetical protein
MLPGQSARAWPDRSSSNTGSSEQAFCGEVTPCGGPLLCVRSPVPDLRRWSRDSWWFWPRQPYGPYGLQPPRYAQFVRPAIASFGGSRCRPRCWDSFAAARIPSAPEQPGRVTGRTCVAKVRREQPGRMGWTSYLRAAWRETALREFVSNEDIAIRRCILPGLPLSTGRHPADLQALVAETIPIARTHPDEYLRPCVEIQIHS